MTQLMHQLQDLQGSTSAGRQGKNRAFSMPGFIEQRGGRDGDLGCDK